MNVARTIWRLGGLKNLKQLNRLSGKKRQCLEIFTGAATTAACFYYVNHKYATCKNEVQDAIEVPTESVVYKKSKFREHFDAKASLEYNDEYLMTGRDFLEAWISDEFYEKPKLKLYDSEYQNMLHSIDSASSFSHIFSATSLISYPDYIFLRSILNRPDDLSLKSFKMLDLDKNGFITLEEYFSLYKMFTKNNTSDPNDHLKTTMRILLFGQHDQDQVTLEKFKQLLKDVHKICLHAEFDRFRKDRKSDMLSVQGFMRAILRRTKLTNIQHARFIDKSEVYNSLGDSISFEQFESMVNLLNNFSDFEVAVRMYQIAKKPLSKDVFKRAAYICSGEKLDDALVDILFYIFDEAGDGHLSHSEFVSIMKEKQTGVTSSKHKDQPLTAGQYFGKCVRTQMWRSYAS